MILDHIKNFLSAPRELRMLRIRHTTVLNNLEYYKKTYDELLVSQKQLYSTLHTLESKNEELSKQIIKQNREGVLEKHWNTKYPSSRITYMGRPPYDIDVRQFVNELDYNIPNIDGKTHDEKAYAAFDWVRRNIRYTADEGEYWKFAWETAKDKSGDCEDGAIIMMNMMLKSGIPYWRVRLNAGLVKFDETKNVGHAWLTYLREADNKWYVLDWCYWPSKSRDWKLTWKKAEDTYFDIWFSWNKYKAFAKADFNSDDFKGDRND